MSDQPSPDLSECADCGAAVLNAEAHKRWHATVATDQKVEQAIANFVRELTTLAEQGRRTP